MQVKIAAPVAADFFAKQFSRSRLALASFPGSPLQAQVYSVTFDPHEKSGGESGEFYHVSDVKGREKFIARGCTQPQCVNHLRISKAGSLRVAL